MKIMSITFMRDTPTLLLRHTVLKLYRTNTVPFFKLTVLSIYNALRSLTIVSLPFSYFWSSHYEILCTFYLTDHMLRRTFEAGVITLFCFVEIISLRVGSNALESANEYLLGPWLNRQEQLHRMVFFVGDADRGSMWTRRCVRQADCVIVLALASSRDPTRLSPLEEAMNSDTTKVGHVYWSGLLQKSWE